MAARATIICLLTLQLFSACIYAVQIDIASVECRQQCASLAPMVDFDKCMTDCFQISNEVGLDDHQMSPQELSAEPQQHRPSPFWSSHRQPVARDDAIVDRKRLSLSPRAVSLVGAGSAHQYLRIGRSYGDSQMENEENSIAAAAAGSRYPIERRNSLTGSRLASAAKSYLRVGKKDAETPDAPSS